MREYFFLKWFKVVQSISMYFLEFKCVYRANSDWTRCPAPSELKYEFSNCLKHILDRESEKKDEVFKG